MRSAARSPQSSRAAVVVTARSVCRLCCAQHDGAGRIIALSRHRRSIEVKGGFYIEGRQYDVQASLPTPSWNVVRLTSPSDHRTNHRRPARCSPDTGVKSV